MRSPLLWGMLVLALSAVAHASGSAQECGMEAKSCIDYGAVVFQERCALCHGSDGLGEGLLSLSLKNYPNTNLLDNPKSNTPEHVARIVRYGSSLPEIGEEMPPWGDELTATQLDSVVQFVSLLRSDLDSALTHLRKAAETIEPSVKIGRAVFKGRCSLCHGEFGLGDGKMARIIKNPPPFNLTLSRVPDFYLSDMIHKGGAAMGRSPRMPPFGGDLSEPEIESVIMFVKTLRK